MTLNGISLNQIINTGTETVGALDIAVGNLAQSGSSTSYSLSLTIVVNQTGPALSITPSSLPNGQVGVSYSQTLIASNGNTPYTWSVSSGSLPGGLSLDPATGAITGTPTTSGAYSFTIQVTDNTGETVSVAFSINISANSGEGEEEEEGPTGIQQLRVVE